MKKSKLIIFTIAIVSLCLSCYSIFNKWEKIYLSKSNETTLILYNTKYATIYFELNTIKNKLKENIKSSDYGGQYYEKLFLNRLDTAKNNIIVYRLNTYKPIIKSYLDTINNPELSKYDKWYNSLKLEDNHYDYALALEWISLELLKEGKAKVYNKVLNKAEEFIYSKKYDNGLSWGEEFKLSNDSIFINAMYGIR